MPESGGIDNQKPVPSQRDVLRGFLDSLFGGSTRQGGYEYFTSRAEREELYLVGKRLAKYAHDKEIANLVFIDRSARLGYLTFMENWRHDYATEPMPNIYFVNPHGFKTIDDWYAPGETGMPRIVEESLIAEKHGMKMDGLEDVKEARGEVVKELERSFKRLMGDKHKPLLFFDTCIHTGDAIGAVGKTFYEAGFHNVHVGIVADRRNTSGLRPDFVALEGKASGGCYPFHNDSLIEKSFGSIVSTVATKPDHADTHRESMRKQVVQEESRKVRDELLRAVREQIATHSS